MVYPADGLFLISTLNDQTVGLRLGTLFVSVCFGTCENMYHQLFQLDPVPLYENIKGLAGAREVIHRGIGVRVADDY
jgi:hypothetical protein